jgi:magnesium chelatase subunit I
LDDFEDVGLVLDDDDLFTLDHALRWFLDPFFSPVLLGPFLLREHDKRHASSLDEEAENRCRRRRRYPRALHHRLEFTVKSRPKTVLELERSGWQSRTVKQELRDNLIAKLRKREPVFPGVVGYDETVLPQLEQALLSGHDFILLGLRGQAKTRLLRALPGLLDEALPAVDGCEIRDDPLRPVCASCKRRAQELGPALPIRWLSREERYGEKLATPDVTIADLIGDIDPIKAATRRLTFADPDVVHYGLIPRSNRGLFAINELPDLAPRIQVGLLGILEEGDVQIRGFPVRLELDLVLAFSANPEDYTNRGSIITPLRDRIASQILTHYPRTLDEASAITTQEAWTDRSGAPAVAVPEYLREALEEVAFQARASEFVDQSSGVSARVGIALLENVVSAAERRGLLSGEKHVVARASDLYSALPALTGKLELVYEGEKEGTQNVGLHLIGRALKTVFDRRLPDAYATKEGSNSRDFEPVLGWFQGGRSVDVPHAISSESLGERLGDIPGLEEVARKYLGARSRPEVVAAMEFVLDGLHQSSLLARNEVIGGRVYRDMFEEMVKDLGAS